MTILAALEQVQQNMPASAIKEFIYADLSEANATYLDDLAAAQLPCLLVLTFDVKDTIGKGGNIRSKFPFHAFLLTKIENPTIDYNSATVETSVIAPMRLLARQYMFRLAQHTIVDLEPGNDFPEVQYNPVYAEFDANLFGVEIVSEIPVVETPIPFIR